MVRWNGGKIRLLRNLFDKYAHDRLIRRTHFSFLLRNSGVLWLRPIEGLFSPSFSLPLPSNSGWERKWCVVFGGLLLMAITLLSSRATTLFWRWMFVYTNGHGQCGTSTNRDAIRNIHNVIQPVFSASTTISNFNKIHRTLRLHHSHVFILICFPKCNIAPHVCRSVKAARLLNVIKG